MPHVRQGIICLSHEVFIIVMNDPYMSQLHSKLRSITPVATKVHVMLRSFVVLGWMRDASEVV